MLEFTTFILTENLRVLHSSSSSSTQSSTSKLRNYLTISFELVDTPEFDLLQWWKEYQIYFSILAIIAKQIFSTTVSIVFMEQEFSACGNILDPKCSCISPESIQV